MNTYRVKETLGSPYDFVNADSYYIDSDNLVFYIHEDGNETEVATFRLWTSVAMMDDVVNEDG